MAEKSNEWYTPAKYIEAAREVMGGIDLDPASCELANQTVRAKRYYSKEDDGLSKEWIAKNVWLNPPFGKTRDGGSNLICFIRKLLQSYHSGNVASAVLLAPSNIDASWFQWLWTYPICFTNHEVPFYETIPHKRRSHIFGTVFVYLGPHEHKFVNTFSQFGRIAKAIDTPRCVEKPIPLWDAERIYA